MKADTLNALAVKHAKPGRHVDGKGLCLVVKPSGAKSWVLRVQVDGKRRDIGLGSIDTLTLADARTKAAEGRRLAKDGIDPAAIWRKEREAVPTFREAAKRLHGELLRSWKPGKHGAQWLSTLEAHAFPRIGDTPVDQIDAGDIRDVLLPIWLEIPETARRVRQRVGAVLDWSHAKGHRPSDAPLRSVNRTLPRQPRRDGHFAAMPYADVPGLLTELRTATTWSRLALEWLILTAARSGEVRGARWDEIDIDEATWTIPADRMKAGKVHTVPLSPAALDVLERAREIGTGQLVFPGRDPRKPMSDMALTKLLRDMGLKATAHGFRSAFRDWAAEETKFPGEIAEAALAHAVPNAVERAYKRTDFLAKRRLMMSAWAKYLESTPAKVVRLPASRTRNSSTG